DNLLCNHKIVNLNRLKFIISKLKAGWSEFMSVYKNIAEFLEFINISNEKFTLFEWKPASSMRRFDTPNFSRTLKYSYSIWKRISRINE
ncbi:unnamed protein product, partial [marine sediment metagenome]